MGTVFRVVTCSTLREVAIIRWLSNWYNKHTFENFISV